MKGREGNDGSKVVFPRLRTNPPLILDPGNKHLTGTNEAFYVDGTVASPCSEVLPFEMNQTM